MKKVILYCVGALLTTIVVFEAIVLSILLLPGGTYKGSYESTLQAKYDLLRTTESPKIIILGGSSCAYGIDADAIVEATGYHVVNMGLHAGMRYPYLNALAKTFAREGDIVLLAYEYIWPDAYSVDTIGTDEIMPAIDDRIEMYRYMPVNLWPSVLGYLFDYAAGKSHAEVNEERDLFSADGNQMTFEREDTLPEYKVPLQQKTVNYEISDESVNHLRELKEYLEERGVSVYFVAAPYAEGSITNKEMLPTLVSNEEEKIGISYISDPLDYEFGIDEMYDTCYHCNSRGEAHRTQLLIQDLAAVGISVQ